MSFDDPRTLALLGASAGFLDPRGGMSAGFQGGLNGLMAGRQMQQQDLAAKMQQQKLMQQMESRQLLQSTIDQQAKLGKTDPISIGNALISTNHPELVNQGLGILKDFRTKVKTTNKVLKDGQEFTQPIFDDGSFGEINSLPNPVRPMQVNQGSQISFVDPNSLQSRGAMGVGMNPGQAAQLAQSANQFQQSQGLAQQRLQLDKRNMVQPKLVDGAWVYPPTADNPQGSMVPTDMYTPPKGSVAAQKSSAGKVNNLLDEAEKYIGGATGSAVGNLADMATGALGVSLPGAQNIARLKTLEAGLVMGMPRLEGPQSNLDQQLYREAAGQIGNPNVPPQTKKAAIETIRKIQNSYPGAFGGSSQPAASNDGWGELR